MQLFKKSGCKEADNEVWAKPDKKLEDRVIRSIVFGTKWLLDKAVWADPDTGVVSIGREEILKAKVIDNKLEIQFGTGWEDYLHDPRYPDFKVLVQAQQKKLSDAEVKGAGKSLGKFAGKFANSAGKAASE